MAMFPTEADKPDSVNQHEASVHVHFLLMKIFIDVNNRTPADNTEDPTSNPEPSESIKRPKRK